MICAATDCTNVGVDLVEMGTQLDERHRRIDATFALCGEHGSLVAAICEEVEPHDLPSFWMAVHGL
jgi:hypothetical protein